MANSKYEYVKLYEVEDEIMFPNIIIVRVDGRDFSRFSQVHEFEKPSSRRALDLMNECAKAVIEKFPDITFSYGHSDEFSFVLKTETKFYQRRASKILTLIVSFFTSVYVIKWKQFFPEDLKYAPSFKSRVILCAGVEVLQAYLAWRQNECHLNNQYDTCLWQLVKSGKPEMEAKEMLEGSQKQYKNELLYQRFNINYKKSIPQIFRQGTCAFKTEVEESVKHKHDGCPVRRSKQKIATVHVENIASTRFWNDQLYLLKELGQFSKDSKNRNKTEYLKSFQYESKLLLSTWVVIRIDGCHFHKFSEVNKFKKPNDEEALNLMNSCAVGVLEGFTDVVFSYGVSDEYSFVLKKESLLYGRRSSEIVSAIVSYFSSMFTMKWKEFFPQKELKYPPYFDGRAVCYPSSDILRDYLAWRQVDCHINNQYNTCFWMLVKSGKSKSEAQNYLKGTQVQEKNELLEQLSGISDYYNTLPPMFRLGSSVFWDTEENPMVDEEEKGGLEKFHRKVTIKHCNIIETGFWEAHPEILKDRKHCHCEL